MDDCVNRLKNMDSKGKVWGQDMIMQVQANHLQLCDIETKVWWITLKYSNLNKYFGLFKWLQHLVPIINITLSLCFLEL